MVFTPGSKMTASEIIISTGQAGLQLGHDFAGLFKQAPYVGSIAALLDDILTVGQEMQSTKAFTEEVLAHVAALSDDISCYLKEMPEYDTAVDQTRGLVHELEEYQKFLQVTLRELKDSLNASRWHKFLGRKGDTVHAWRRTLGNYQMRFQNRILLNILTLLVPNNRDAPKQTSKFSNQIPNTVTDQRETEKKLLEAVSHSDDILRRACALQRLGIFYIQNDRIKDAQEAVRRSLELCEKKEIRNQVLDERDGKPASTRAVASKSGEPEEIFSQKNQSVLNAADASTSVLPLSQQRKDVTSQIYCQRKPAPVYVNWGPIHDAEKVLKAEEKVLKAEERVLKAEKVFKTEKVLKIEKVLEAEKVLKGGEVFKAALDLPRDALSAAGLHQDLGQQYFNSGQLDDAEESFTEALILFTRCDSCHGQATNYFKLGRLYWCKKQLEDAEWAFQSALRLRRQEKNASGQAYNHQMLGQVYADKRCFEDAEKELKAGLKLHREGSPVVVIAGNHQELGQLYMAWGRLENAVEELQEARRLYGSYNHLEGEAKNLYKLGRVYAVMGRLEEAEEAFQNALRLRQSEKNIAGQAWNCQELGEINLRQGRLKQAKISFEKALTFHRQNKDLAAQADIHMKLEDVHSRLGRRR